MSNRREQIEAMLVDAPNDPELHYFLAMEHVSAGDDASAVRCFQQLLQVAPSYVPAYLQAGQALARLGRIDEAVQIWQRGVPEADRQGNLHARDELLGFIDAQS